MATFDKLIVKIGGKARELLEKPLADALFMRISGGNFTGPVTSSSTIKAAGGFYHESDIRLKENIENLDLSLEDLNKLSLVFFNFINDPTKSIQVGVLADEVKDICPELVSEDENGYLNVQYDKLSVLALKGIQLLYTNQLKIMEELSEIKSKVNVNI